MSGASTYWFGKAALKSGFYPRRRLMRDAWKAFWFKRVGASDEQSNAVRDQILNTVAGRTQAGMMSFLPDVLGPILINVYPEVFRRILDHEREGAATYLVSASPVEIVGPVARALGMSGGALATTAAGDCDGVYTGELVGAFCYGAGKVEAMQAEAARTGIDLAASWAYSDSASDLPMLEAVGHQVAVNPDKRLRDVAREREWEILRTEARHGLRAIVAAGIVTGGAGVGVGTALILRRLNRRS